MVTGWDSLGWWFLDGPEFFYMSSLMSDHPEPTAPDYRQGGQGLHLSFILSNLFSLDQR